MTRVSLDTHDVDWGDRFAAEHRRVESALPADDEPVACYHIGSTAIPDLPTKATLDMVAVLSDREAMASARDALLRDGFGRHRDDPDWVVLTRSGTDCDVCLHLRARENEVWRQQVAFREYLRDDVRARARYDRAKREAATAYPTDVDAYTDAKAPIIRQLTEEALARGFGDRV